MHPALAWLALLMLGLPQALRAAPEQAPANPAQQAFQNALQAARQGPAEVALDQQATLQLPAGQRFVPQPQAAELLRAMGNPGQHADVRGLIFPAEASGWFAIVSWDAAGYVKDDDAKEWNAEELLQSYRDGTEAANAERQKAGATPIEVVGWAEKPAYDAGTHRLVWAMSLRDQGAAADAEQSVNYNTYALGREGYLSLNLVTDLKDLPAHRAAAQQLLGAIRYNEGKRYADFDSRTDKVAEYGLAALVLGVGAKKLGLFAVAAAFLLTAVLGGAWTWLWLTLRGPLSPSASWGDEGALMPSLGGFLIAAVLAPVVGEAIRQIGPVVLAARPEFDDLMDGLTFGVISGVGFATADTLVKHWPLITGGYAGVSDAPTWISLLVLEGFVKPLLMGTATGIADDRSPWSAALAR